MLAPHFSLRLLAAHADWELKNMELKNNQKLILHDFPIGGVNADIEIPLDSDQKMLSPKIEGRILDSLDIMGHESALEIGTGSGYFTSVLARLCKSVKSIEVSKELSELAEDKINALKFTNVSIVTGDALTYNFDNERFDIVVVGCALPKMHEDLKRLLKVGGKLFIVVGTKNHMHATLVKRINESEWQSKSLFETHLDYMKGSEPKEEFTF
jgi:protein-L-isoaspartate(D-aspartate) O-methyltransferase